MIDTKQPEQIPETFTVDVNQELQIARVTSPKHKADFIVSKTRYSQFFNVRTTVGILPAVLSGKYTSLESAIKSISEFIRNTKETFAVRSERLHQERQQRKHAESEPKNN